MAVVASPIVDQLINPAAKPTHYPFSFDDFLKKEYRFGIPSDRPVCKAFMNGHCPLGNACPDKHPAKSTQYNNLICKHWMRGLCKKGDSCEFLHEYNLRKMPECNRQPTCPAGDECPYQHTDPAFKRPSCPHFDRGFCPLGPICANRHVRKVRICQYYLVGFCPNGRECQEGAHPRFSEDMRPPEVIKPKTQEELDREREEAEQRAREEAEREMMYEERGGGGDRGDRGGRGRGWGANRRRGRRGKRGDRFERLYCKICKDIFIQWCLDIQ